MGKSAKLLSPSQGNVKVTCSDWLNAARDILVDRGVEDVKVLTLSAKLGVSRSSFYWYYKDRKALLDDLVMQWEAANIKTFVEYCEIPTQGIDGAVCNFFRCFINPELLDKRLDFAIRDWARRDPSVRDRLDQADTTRLNAVIAMFTRFDYPAEEAEWRARIIYFMQLGYHALEIREDMETRLTRLQGYIKGFTGREADPNVLADFCDYSRKVAASNKPSVSQ